MKPLNVEVQDGLPRSVNGRVVSHLVDRYRLWPRWWEGYTPRDYYLLELDNKTLELYLCDGSWTLARTLD